MGKNKVETVVDKLTGEIVSEKVTSTKYTPEPEYVKLYLRDVVKLFDLSGTTKTVFIALLRKMNYDNEILLAGKMKEEMAESMKMKKNTFEHSMGELVVKGVLLKKGNNWYLVNPNLIGKGSWEHVQRIILTLTYDKSGRMIQTNFSTQMELFDEQKTP
jgi:hypothetical protein